MSGITVPNGWMHCTLADIAAPIPNAIADGPFGSNLKLSDYVDEGVPVLQGKNITGDSFRWCDVRFISEYKAEDLKRSSVRVGDILLVKIGSIGYSAIVDDLHGYDRAIIPANLAKVTPDPCKVDTKYLHRWLSSQTVKEYLARAASKTAQPALSLRKIRDLEIPLPPIPEQQRIAAVLDRAEALRRMRRDTLVQLNQLTQAIFLDMFGDPATNPRGWPASKLGVVLSDAEVFTDGDWVESKDQDPAGEVRLIQLADVGDGTYLDKSTRFLTKRTALRLRCTFLRPGDLLLARMPDPLGRACIFPGDEKKSVTVVDVCVVRPGSAGPNPIWLMGCINSPGFRSLISRKATGTTRTRISRGNLASIPVILPPLADQQEFARRAAAVDRLKTAQRASLAELDALFASLQHRAFRGEL